MLNIRKSIEKLSMYSRISQPTETLVLNIVALFYKTIGLVLGRTAKIMETRCSLI